MSHIEGYPWKTKQLGAITMCGPNCLSRPRVQAKRTIAGMLVPDLELERILGGGSDWGCIMLVQILHY